MGKYERSLGSAFLPCPRFFGNAARCLHVSLVRITAHVVLLAPRPVPHILNHEERSIRAGITPTGYVAVLFCLSNFRSLVPLMHFTFVTQDFPDTFSGVEQAASEFAMAVLSDLDIRPVRTFDRARSSPPHASLRVLPYSEKL